MYKWIFLLLACSRLGWGEVLVSVAPTKFLVEEITGGRLEVVLLVPAGVSPHSYEPTFRQVDQARGARIWFRSGEDFERRALAAFERSMQIVDLRAGLPLLSASCGCSHPDSTDSHIWLSPQLLKGQIATIEGALSSLYPDLAPLFKENAKKLLDRVEEVDQAIRARLSSLPRPHTLLVAHPAFAYFCRDYGLEQLAIEFEGKEPTPRQLMELVTHLERRRVREVFVQPQYSQKGASQIARLFNLPLVTLDPYAEDVLSNLLRIAEQIAR